MAYSATAVLPAEVWAATRTHSFRSRHATAVSWKGSREKGYVLAMGPRQAGASMVPCKSSERSSLQSWRWEKGREKGWGWGWGVEEGGVAPREGGPERGENGEYTCQIVFI